MNKIVSNKGDELNAQFKIAIIDDELGLTLESRGGKKRNTDYNLALETLLERLKKVNIEKIKIKVVSSNLLKEMPNPLDRTIFWDKKPEINLKKNDIKDLRKDIGAAVSKLKTNKSTKGGNPTKRIQLISSLLDEHKWKQIAFGEMSGVKPFKNEDIFSFQEFEKEVAELLKLPIESPPMGNPSPKKKQNSSTEVFERDPKVKAWVLKNASGKCECCKQDSPFISTNGIPYLEVHHLKLLTNGGSDTIENTVALCPNCHREFHHGINREKIKDRIFREIHRLVEE